MSPDPDPAEGDDDAGGSPPPTGDRIAKVIARAGVASRRDAEKLILAGRVAVNGAAIDSPALNVGPGDVVTVDGAPLEAPEPPRLFRYHKPNGLVTTARDERGRETIFDHLPDGLPRLMPVGRLDLTSEGLLLLTNDGALKRRLELPATGWVRKYRVRVHGAPTEDALAPLGQGIEVDGERFQPMLFAIDRQQGANAWLTLGLTEGKNREIRRALEAIGFPVTRLIRVAYGPFRLGALAKGAVDEVRAKVLREQLGVATETPHERERRARTPTAAAPAEVDPTRPRRKASAKNARRTDSKSAPERPQTTASNKRPPSNASASMARGGGSRCVASKSGASKSAASSSGASSSASTASMSSKPARSNSASSKSAASKSAESNSASSKSAASTSTASQTAASNAATSKPAASTKTALKKTASTKTAATASPTTRSTTRSTSAKAGSKPGAAAGEAQRNAGDDRASSPPRRRR